MSAAIEFTTNHVGQSNGTPVILDIGYAHIPARPAETPIAFSLSPIILFLSSTRADSAIPLDIAISLLSWSTLPQSQGLAISACLKISFRANCLKAPISSREALTSPLGL